MDIKITPRSLNGSLRVPASKSGSHRAIISAGLSKGTSKIDNIVFSKDIRASLSGMRALGMKFEIRESKEEFGSGSVWIEGLGGVEIVGDKIDANESGSTLRFLIPIAALAKEKIIFTGKGKLIERPLDTYYHVFDEQEIEYRTSEGRLPLTIYGGLKAGKFRIPGNISSQFISGLLFALPLLEGDSSIEITSTLESRGYVDLTIQVLDHFGIKIEHEDYKCFFVEGRQEYKKRDYTVEGDYSQAAFFLVAGILGGEVACRGLNTNSLQGDKVILDLINKMGGDISIGESIITRKSNTYGIEIDASQCPDLVPILATLAAVSKGTTRIINAERLRIKESDRLKAMTTELNKLGADVRELEDGLEIKGRATLRGGVVDSWNDHRIAMALAIASIKCENEVIIKNSQAVNKSYPGFWSDFEKLGGRIDERDMGEKA